MSNRLKLGKVAHQALLQHCLQEAARCKKLANQYLDPESALLYEIAKKEAFRLAKVIEDFPSGGKTKPYKLTAQTRWFYHATEPHSWGNDLAHSIIGRIISDPRLMVIK